MSVLFAVYVLSRALPLPRALDSLTSLFASGSYGPLTLALPVGPDPPSIELLALVPWGLYVAALWRTRLGDVPAWGHLLLLLGWHALGLVLVAHAYVGT